MANENIIREFQEFGNRMNTIAILAILSFVIPFVGIIELIFIFMALGNINRINQEMPNQNLMEFRSKYISSFIVSLIGLFIIFIGVFALIGVIPYIYSSYRAIMNLITGFIILLIISLILMIISAYMESRAWENLIVFFENNRQMFPEMIVMDVLNGARNLKTGAIIRATIIIAFVGVILQIIGYFKLASLGKLYDAYSQPITYQPQFNQPPVQVQPQSTFQPQMSGAFNYCPHCGSQIKRAGNFCTSCGAELK